MYFFGTYYKAMIFYWREVLSCLKFSLDSKQTIWHTPLQFLREGIMENKESRRRGPKERPVPQKNPEEHSAAERMRIARQKAGKTLSDTARALDCHPRYLSHVETGKKPVSLSIARQYEQLFGQEPGQIIKTIYERPHKRPKNRGTS